MADEQPEDTLNHYKHRGSTFRVLCLLAAIVFGCTAAWTIWGLVKEVMSGVFGNNPLFGMTTLNHFFTHGALLLGSGLAYLIFGALRDHYDEKVYQLTAAHEAMLQQQQYQQQLLQQQQQQQYQQQQQQQRRR
jgi:hypothetical protein